MLRRSLFVYVSCVALWPAGAVAQATPWSYSASAYFYVVPDDRNYLQPTVTADRDWLHLEARLNYESLEAASMWAGYNIAFGGDVAVALTPQLGLVLGEVTGIAPGGRVWVGWKQLEFYSEGEYVVDLDTREDSFFYSWSELTVAPTGELRAGLAMQRTQAYETPREFQGGLLLGGGLKSVQLTGYVFDLDQSDHTYVLSLSAEF